MSEFMLAPEQVAALEEVLGFETTGAVTCRWTPEREWGLYENLLTSRNKHGQKENGGSIPTKGQG